MIRSNKNIWRKRNSNSKNKSSKMKSKTLKSQWTKLHIQIHSPLRQTMKHKTTLSSKLKDPTIISQTTGGSREAAAGTNPTEEEHRVINKETNPTMPTTDPTRGEKAEAGAERTPEGTINRTTINGSV